MLLATHVSTKSVRIIFFILLTYSFNKFIYCFLFSTYPAFGFPSPAQVSACALLLKKQLFFLSEGVTRSDALTIKPQMNTDYKSAPERVLIFFRIFLKYLPHRFRLSLYYKKHLLKYLESNHIRKRTYIHRTNYNLSCTTKKYYHWFHHGYLFLQ